MTNEQTRTIGKILKEQEEIRNERNLTGRLSDSMKDQLVKHQKAILELLCRSLSS